MIFKNMTLKRPAGSTSCRLFELRRCVVGCVAASAIGVVAAISISAPASAQGLGATCGSVAPSAGQFGPFDYRTDRGNQLSLVEQGHFTPEVEALIRGANSRTPAGDLDYTLRAFPNHHRALIAMMNYGERTRSPQPAGANYTVECYFDRAVRFRPDDSIVRMIYATYLAGRSRRPEAIQQLERATANAGDNPFTQYNIGLVYFDLKEYDKALAQAHKAITLGFPQTALRDQLRTAGKWTEPPSATTAVPGAAPNSDTATAAGSGSATPPPEAIPK